MPVVLMFDGPSLGGFVCPATITSSQIWKMGQVSANDTINFKCLTLGKSLLPSEVTCCALCSYNCNLPRGNSCMLKMSNHRPL